MKAYYFVLGYVFAIALFLSYCYQIRTHNCKWEHCPYKNVPIAKAGEAVDNYIGADAKYSDEYCIDVLHIQHPDASYDELEDMLFKPGK